jgi:DNA helicase-2/ATP-dependent DNA helicase PcrA
MLEFTTMIRSFSAEIDKKPAYELAHHIAKSSGVLKDLYTEKDKGPEEVERYQNIEELLNAVQAFTESENSDVPRTLSDFMIDVALLTDADSEKDEDRDKISLMTIHSSKGLEFPHVFLVGLEENLFPSQMVLNSRTELEEERRLFYVALTRAEKTCTITYANSRFNWGQLNYTEPSRFIAEIDREYVEYEAAATQAGGGRSLGTGMSRGGLNQSLGLNKTMGSAPRNLTSLSSLSGKSAKRVDNSDLKVGYNVIHERFGKGKITDITGVGDDRKATIFFPKEGSKTLLLRFAQLSVVED